MWNISDYEREAKAIATNFVESGGEATIDDQAVKIATQHGMNPDGVRTLVRLANVCTFEGLMAKAAETSADDRMIEYVTGDAEKVLDELHTVAKTASAAEVDTKSYRKEQDYHLDMAREAPAPLEKVAEAKPVAAIPVNVWDVKLRFQKARQKFAEDRSQAQTEWFLAMEKAANHLKAADSRVSFRTQFEKDALASLGEGIAPELRMLQTLTGAKEVVVLCGGEKIATVISQHVPLPEVVQGIERPILEAVKQAQTARQKARLCEAGCTWLDDNVPA